MDTVICTPQVVGIDYGRLLAQAARFIVRRILLPFVLSLLVAGFSATAVAASYPSHAQHVRQALLAKFHHWQGTPYRYGGMSHRGIDCSGFVHVIYRQALGIDVPRSTELLSRIHHPVSRRHLVAGDLLLFRINRHTLHAGIYVGHGQFIHASKTRGVMLSSLRNPYWREVYSKAVRVIDTRA
jgi:cell wall-associated NlpC family hydrolase